jgi:methylase of polypeptide subunit release factors
MEWLSKCEIYKDYKIILNQSSEPITNAGFQSNQNKYLENYKRIKDLLVNRDVYLISDNLNKQFKNWIKLEFGWNHLTYHFHFDIDITITEFLKYPIEYKTNDFNKKIITFNGSMDNEHKQFVKKMMTNLNLWDISYWSFSNDSNFGMEMYQHSKNLFLIFNKAIPIVSKSFLYLVTETVCDNFYTNTDIRIDFMSKMGRALAFPTPFVVVGNFGILKHLKELGFKTFSNWFDESYDDIEDLNDRMNAISKLVENLKNITFQDQLKMRNEMLEVFEHNRNILLKLSKEEKKLINLEIPNFFNKFEYEQIDYKIMETIDINRHLIFYDKHLDGGGSTFGINALKSENVKKHIKGNTLEICSGPGFMGYFSFINGYSSNITFSDINKENKKYIDKTSDFNGFNHNIKFIESNVFDNINDDVTFETIISNPPHFKTPRPDGYRSEHEKLISLDENMEFHKKFFKDVKNFINENSSIILVENCAGVTADDIIEMTKDDFKVELIEYDKYGWEGESTFYTIILYLLPNN